MPDAVRNESIRQTRTMAALQSPSFRLYFAGQLVSVSGTWMQTVAQQVVVYELTKSELALGAVACVQGLPALILTPFAGVIVERLPRQKLLILTQAVMMVLALILAALQFTNATQVWHIVVLSFIIGMANALDAPARQAFVVEMVGRDQLTSGIVMNSIMFNAARIVGPALGGLALKTIGPAWCFFLNGLSFLAVLISLWVMVVPPHRRTPGPLKFLGPLKEGVQFARTHSSIRPLLLMSLITSLFGITFAVLLPSFADLVLRDTSGGTAVLLTAQGVGAIIAGVLVARFAGSGHGGWVLTIYSLLGPLFVILFALSSSLIMATITVTIAGFCLIGQFIMMNTLIQTEVPDEFRGRVLSLYTLTFFGFNPFSSLAIGALAEWLGQTTFLHQLLPFAIDIRATGTVAAIALFGAAALILNGTVLALNPQVRELR